MISFLFVILLTAACTKLNNTQNPKTITPAPAAMTLLPAAISPLPATMTPELAKANPASENCTKQGGTLSIQSRGDGSQYGICMFEDNRQCEEWALLYGDCPVGGLKVTGYITPAAQYCAITGGTYTITGNSNTDNEQGNCTLKDNTVCDVWDYYNGKCTSGSAATSSVPAGNWQWYVSQEVGYALQVPSTWSQKTLPDQNGGAIHGVAYTGTEGEVEVYWGIGFGGACTTGTQQVQLASGETTACYARNSDATEVWSQIGYQVDGGNSFSVKAYTSNAQPSSHDLVLQVLLTLTFRVPVTVAIQPLTIEVCDGQAQAMSHTLDDLVPTQSEELLDDFIKDAWGTGCQATITGTGVQFKSPDVAVNALGSLLKGEGWTEDPNLAAGGATGIGAGYRKDDQICLANAMWRPDASANCPKDQPISACQVTPEQQNYTVTLNCGEEVPVGQATPSAGGGAGQLVFDSTRGGSGYRDLYVMNSQGNDVSRLTRGEANNFAGPWSPDGTRIVYTTYGVTNSYIAVIDADGSNQIALDQVQGSDEGFPDWSPDGKRIAFTSRRDGNNEIYLMNADGSNQVRLTNSPTDDFAPSWSPDGKQIVFVSDRDNLAGVYDLYFMNADGSGVKRLTNDKASQYSPDWSPDGKMIVFRADDGKQADIYVINVDGSGLRNLTNNPANDWAPTWSPDGLQIAFQTNRDGNWEIYVMAADGSQPLNLTKDPSDDQLPYWTP
jgi:Tol biopolymer transport system component/putative hemolysin